MNVKKWKLGGGGGNYGTGKNKMMKLLYYILSTLKFPVSDFLSFLVFHFGMPS